MKKNMFSVLFAVALASLVMTSNANATSYVVQPGDTLWKIANQHHLTVQQLREMNQLQSDAIQAKQKLVISKDSQMDPPPTTSHPAATYVVKVGDSLWSIANAHQMTVDQLRSMNGLAADTIRIGQKLQVAPMQTNQSVTKVFPKATSSTNSWKSTSTSATAPVPVSSISSMAAALSYTYLDTPYVWGGITPTGFDCSGFIYYVYTTAGAKLPRYDTVGMYVNATEVMEPQKGDLVFFENTYRSGISHAGIYVGNGQFIHAGSKRVEIASLDWLYWKERFAGFKRLNILMK